MPFASLLRAGLLTGALIGTTAQAANGPLLSELILGLTPLIQVSATDFEPGTPARASAKDFARSARVGYSLDDGQWREHGDVAIWRLKLGSRDALNLSVTLGQIQLPDTAQLRLYDSAGLLWHGPYDGAELNRRGRFWSPIIPGEVLLLELSVPRAERDAAGFIVEGLHHGFADLDPGAKAGSCNIDTACPESDSWNEAVRATARITLGGRRICSAVLLNNTREDGAPLLLTASHCGVGVTNEFPAESVVVYWNYASSRCGGNRDGSLRQNQSGAQLLASGSRADWTLLRLLSPPQNSFQVYFAGWDASGATPFSGVSVHHPSGDEKSISFFTDRANPRTANVDGNSVQSWEVFWSRGVTEPGSSGAGLFNSASRVVGQLSGGNSSCSNTGGADVYGRLDIAWQESSASSGQLKAWLDPDNSGLTRFDGRDSTSIARAEDDAVLGVPEDRGRIQIDVLNNDTAPHPLRLVDAQSDSGLVRIEDNALVFNFDDVPTAHITYTVQDRHGDLHQARATVSRHDSLDLRGGSLGWLLLTSLLLMWRRP